jgi:NADPH2:quinone reductase
LPHILGRDASGIITQLGAGVTEFKVGDAVAILRSEIGVTRNGTFAELVAAPVDSIVPLPPSWTKQEAAGAALVYLTAYQALTMWGDMPESGVVLISGASGGVGVAAVQLAVALGHSALALTRSKSKGKTLIGLGAARSFDPQEADWPAQVKSFLGKRRVDLAVDNIGGSGFSQMLEVLGDHGRVSCVGRLAGTVPDFNTASLFFRRLRIGGVAVGAYTREEAHEAWQHVLKLLARRGAKPLIDSVYAFDELPRAFEKLSAGPMGKVLIRVKELAAPATA